MAQLLFLALFTFSCLFTSHTALPHDQHEIKGLSAYIKYSLNSRFPDTLHFPIMTVIGTRIPSRLAHALCTMALD